MYIPSQPAFPMILQEAPEKPLTVQISPGKFFYSWNVPGSDQEPLLPTCKYECWPHM